MQKQFSRKNIFHNGAGALHTLTASFVAVDDIDVGPQSEVSLELSSGGTAPTSIVVQVKVSYDGGSNYKIIELIPKNGIILLTAFVSPYILLLQPDARYRLEFKHDGTGDGTTTLLVVGSSRRPYGVRLANRAYLSAGVPGSVAVGGNVDHDDVDAGYPVKGGGKASTSGAVAVQDGDRVNADYTLEGLQRIYADVAKIAGTAIVEAGVSGLQAIGGNVDHDVADTGYPIKTGGVATTSEATVVGDGDRVQSSYTRAGRQRTDVDITRVNGTVALEGGVSGLIATAGNVAHHTTDVGYPNKLGGKGVNTVPTAVDNDDRVDAYFDLEGYQQNRVQGATAHDAADAGDPIKTGGTATGAEATIVDEGDRVQSSYTRYGRQRVDNDLTRLNGTVLLEGGVNGLMAFAGNVAHDGVDVGHPIKNGGKAHTSEPGAVGNGDRVNAYYDENGYQIVKSVGTTLNDAADDGTAPNKVGGVVKDVLTLMSDGDRAEFLTDLYGRLRNVDATYDSFQDANASVSRNGPETQQNQETIANVTNGANGTYDYFIDMTNRRKCGIQLELTGTFVIKIYGCIQADGTVPASCTMQDITLDTFKAASFTATGMLIDNAEKLASYHYIQIEVVASGGGTDDWTIFHKRLY